MHINGENGAGITIEDALREFIADIVREELKTDWPKESLADSDPEADEEPEYTGYYSPEPDSVPTMEDVVARAKEVMTEDGGKARLKTALSSVGATRVSAIPEDKITEFMEALDD